MKTLVLEPDPMRARNWVIQFGSACDRVDVARSRAQARLMLIGASYDRLCLRMADNPVDALLSVARATSPDCQIVDLTSLTARLATGPIPDGDTPRACRSKVGTGFELLGHAKSKS